MRPRGKQARIDFYASESQKIAIQWAEEQRGMPVTEYMLHLHEGEMKRLK